jgi:protein ImuA
MPAHLQASPAPLRLLLAPRPRQQLSVQVLKRRGPVLERTLLVDLPQPPATLQPARTGMAAPPHGRPVPAPPPVETPAHSARSH